MVDHDNKSLLNESAESDAVCDAVFETFLVLDNGRVFMLKEHLDRMKASVADLELGPLPNTEQLSRDIRDLAEKEECRNRVLRVRYSPSKSVDNRYAYETREPVEYDADNGLQIIVSESRRNSKSYLVYHKTNNYLENRIALKMAKKKGYDDALFFNTEGDLAETTKANIFLVKDDKLLTPSIESGILPGVVRAWTIRQAIKNDISTLQLFIDPDEISQAQEVFVTNSVLGICRVGRIDMDGHTLFSSPKDTPITKMLSDTYQRESKSEGDA